eukprot:Platyproteum_vivax@DN15148_c0_g1_i1.p1
MSIWNIATATNLCLRTVKNIKGCLKRGGGTFIDTFQSGPEKVRGPRTDPARCQEILTKIVSKQPKNITLAKISSILLQEFSIKWSANRVCERLKMHKVERRQPVVDAGSSGGREEVLHPLVYG